MGIKVRDRGEVKTTRTEDPTLRVGDHVMLELDNDQTFGTVYAEPHYLPFIPPMRVMKKTLRRANDEDERTIARHNRIVQEGREVFQERMVALGLHMKLVEVYGSFQRRVLTFTYTADGRVDFRQLVKESCSSIWVPH